MAFSARYGTHVVTRAAFTPLSTTTTTLPIRSFSTSHCLRDDRPSSSKPAVAPRSNPLIGNYKPLRPVATKTADPAPLESASKPVPSPTAPSDLPPPPPPRAAAEAPKPAATKPAPFAYDAADPNRGLNLDIHALLASKADQASADHKSKKGGDPTKQPAVYTKAVTGRTIFITEGGRPGPNTVTMRVHAFSAIQRLLNAQRVKRKAQQQKFHERPGMKKKRLKRERWRLRFKTGFKATVSRVLELKKQGW